MAFFEAVFPMHISRDAEGGPRFPGQVSYIGGRRLVLQPDELPTHEYTISHPAKTGADFEELRAFFYVVGGNRDAFRMRDWADYMATGANSVLTLVSGNEYQLMRTYKFGSRTYVRTIKKPEAVDAVYRTRSGVTTDATADCTVDLTTGRVVIANHVALDTYAWAGTFHVPVALKDPKAAWRYMGTPQMFTEWPSIELEEDRLA